MSWLQPLSYLLFQLDQFSLDGENQKQKLNKEQQLNLKNQRQKDNEKII